MKFKIEINCDNAAFEDALGGDQEVARILRSLADRIERGELREGFGGCRVVDLNGNTVGHCGYHRG